MAARGGTLGIRLLLRHECSSLACGFAVVSVVAGAVRLRAHLGRPGGRRSARWNERSSPSLSVTADAAARPDDDESVSEPSPVGQPHIGEAAFTAVFQEHYTTCVRLARRIVRDKGLAQEVVQEVFLAWWRAAGGGYRPDQGGIAAWLSTLTHHKAVDAVRTAERHRRLQAAAASALPLASKQHLVDEVVWWELGRQSLIAALPTLTPAQHQVLCLAYGTGLSQAEIAQRLGIPLGTVKSRTHAGMLRLRAAIGGTWTPTEAAARPQRKPTFSPSASAQDRHEGEPRTRTSTGIVRDDVHLCATELVDIILQEHDERPNSAALLSRAAALADRHGETGMFHLVEALARLAAGGATSLRASGASARRHRHEGRQDSVGAPGALR